ncbi:hypothetical protein [uncultured Proteiniphilum sp.]|uniref:hypothetical protein n=1 Tax=uncultured Proteiniphilum sp. TaxID=497637 RepID=UPI0026221B58|nr:hypothetical protein [uncultured Proteiniphilum sp.]
MKTTSYFIPLCVIFGLIVIESNAQDLNDEMKKRLRQSLITPEKQSGYQPLQHAPQILPGQDREVLKVSPTTRLPTKSDQIQVLHPPEKYKIHIETRVTNSIPINQRPAGSVKYEFVGKNMMIIPTAGQRVVPSGHDFDPIRTRNRQRHERTDRLVKAYNNK